MSYILAVLSPDRRWEICRSEVRIFRTVVRSTALYLPIVTLWARTKHDTSGPCSRHQQLPFLQASRRMETFFLLSEVTTTEVIFGCRFRDIQVISQVAKMSNVKIFSSEWTHDGILVHYLKLSLTKTTVLIVLESTFSSAIILNIDVIGYLKFVSWGY